MTSSDVTALPADAKARSAGRVGVSLDAIELGGAVVAGARIGFACGEFNGGISDRMLSSALDALESAGGDLAAAVVVWVAGAFELPLAARALAASGKVDAVIALGAVIRGDTGHYDFVAGECASGLQRVQLDTGIPVVFGVLTTDTVDQAVERSMPDDTNKGAEALHTALGTLAVLRGIDGLQGTGRVGFAKGRD